MGASTAAQVAGPAFIAFGIDQGLPALIAGNAVPIVGVVALYLVVGVIGAVLIGWDSILTARGSQAILLALRTRVFRHTQRLSLEFHERYTSGRIIARQTSDLDAISELLDSGLNQLVSGVLFMSFTVIALFGIDPISGVVLLCSLVPFAILTRWFQVRSQTRFRSTRTASARRMRTGVGTIWPSRTATSKYCASPTACTALLGSVSWFLEVILASMANQPK